MTKLLTCATRKISRYRWGLEYSDCITSRERDHIPKGGGQDVKLNYIWFWGSSSRFYGVPLHCYYFQVHFHPEWLGLLGYYLCVKYICLKISCLKIRRSVDLFERWTSCYCRYVVWVIISWLYLLQKSKTSLPPLKMDCLEYDTKLYLMMRYSSAE